MAQLQIIQSKIYEIRGQRVMLDRDLAELYQVTTGNLNKAVKRNIKRFPPDFMFQLTTGEWESLRFQIGIIETGRGKYTKYLPYAFAELGGAMLSSVLNSKTAIEINRNIMRAFVAIKQLMLPMLILIYKHINKIGYKTAKRRFALEIRDIVIAMIVEKCGGDSKIFFKHDLPTKTGTGHKKSRY